MVGLYLDLRAMSFYIATFIALAIAYAFCVFWRWRCNQIKSPKDRDLTSGPLTDELIHKLLRQTLKVIQTGDRDAILRNSLHNCHESTIDSIFLGRINSVNSARVFIARKSHAYGTYAPGVLHDNNETFIVHNHRTRLISIDLCGRQIQSTFVLDSCDKENGNGEQNSDVDTYVHYKFHSAVIGEGKVKFDRQGLVQLRANPVIEGPWKMETDEIHRVYWPDDLTIALLIEGPRTDSYSDPTDAYLISSAKEIPCGKPSDSGAGAGDDGSLYLPMERELFDAHIDRIVKCINVRLTS